MTAEETLTFYASLVPEPHVHQHHHHHQDETQQALHQQQHKQQHEQQHDLHMLPISSLALELAERASSAKKPSAAAAAAAACCLRHTPVPHTPTTRKTSNIKYNSSSQYIRRGCTATHSRGSCWGLRAAGGRQQQQQHQLVGKEKGYHHQHHHHHQHQHHHHQQQQQRVQEVLAAVGLSGQGSTMVST
jgi:hypothetical protein